MLTSTLILILAIFVIGAVCWFGIKLMLSINEISANQRQKLTSVTEKILSCRNDWELDAAVYHAYDEVSDIVDGYSGSINNLKIPAKTKEKLIASFDKTCKKEVYNAIEKITFEFDEER